MEIYNKLFKGLNPADLILTRNKRLIPFLHKAYAHYQQTQKNRFGAHCNVLHSLVS